MFGNNTMQMIAQLRGLVGSDPDKAMQELQSINPQFKEFSQKPLDEIAKEYNIDIEAIRKMIG